MVPHHRNAPRHRGHRLALAGVLGVACFAARAQAAPDEVEVYRDDLTRTRTWGLEVNQNYVVSGTRENQASGALSPVHLYRLTPELNYGVAASWEAGLLAVTTVRNTAFDAHGVKGHVRFIAPRSQTNPWYWGFNLELGWTDRHLEARPITAEWRGIAGYEGRRWILAFNPTVETAWDGRVVEPASVELQSKIGYRASDTLIVGFESYNELGHVRQFGPLRDEPQMLYAAADITLPRGDLNLGVGRGLTGSSDGWAVKVVWSLPLTRKPG